MPGSQVGRRIYQIEEHSRKTTKYERMLVLMER
jgi:hypothetical protein